MALGSDNIIVSRDAAVQAEFDAGLRSHMLKVYNYMASGVMLTGIMAYVVAHTPAVFNLIFGTPLVWVAMFAPLAFVFFFSFRFEKMSAATTQTMFWIFCALMGVSMSTIFVAFTDTSVARVFFITTGTFAAMSLWGYTTKKDLSGWGNFLFMGVIGLILASVVNIFLGSTGLQFAISVIGVLVFVGLTAYDTQRIKVTYAEHWDEDSKTKLAVFGALGLYINFVMIFQYLMMLLGNRE